MMYRFDATLTKIPQALFYFIFILEINNLTLKSICKCKETKLSKVIFKITKFEDLQYLISRHLIMLQ